MEFRNGCIVWNRIEGKVEVFDNDGHRIGFGPTGFGMERVKESLESESEDTIDTISETSMDEVFEAFTGAVTSGGDIYCPIEENGYTMTAALALEKSCELNRPVRFADYLNDEGLTGLLADHA